MNHESYNFQAITRCSALQVEFHWWTKKNLKNSKGIKSYNQRENFVRTVIGKYPRGIVK